MERYFGENMPKLGFGLMRLPKKKDHTIDIEQTEQMVDLFMQAGMTYFDTAFVYDQGESEKAIRKALVERYPRESFTIATKLNAWMGNPDEQSAKQQFYTSLERLHVDFIDYYLLHAVRNENIQRYDEFQLWDYVRDLKETGKIRHWGFSFHGTPALLEELLQKHPDVDFVQLQLNYADWENPSVASRQTYEIARKYNKSIVIMEPVKGGLLANPPKKMKEIFDVANKKASYASWAIRYAASLDGVMTVLSGMSNLEQMKDNLSYMKEFHPLDEAERAVIAKVQEEVNQMSSIACTSCHYCTEGCPRQIKIPEIFAARNMQLIWGQMERGKQNYMQAIEGGGKASDCIACGQCERACPQHLTIIEWLKDCAKQFD